MIDSSFRAFLYARECSVRICKYWECNDGILRDSTSNWRSLIFRSLFTLCCSSDNDIIIYSSREQSVTLKYVVAHKLSGLLKIILWTAQNYLCCIFKLIVHESKSSISSKIFHICSILSVCKS